MFSLVRGVRDLVLRALSLVWDPWELLAICIFAITGTANTKAVRRGARAECVWKVFLEYGICGIHVCYVWFVECLCFFNIVRRGGLCDRHRVVCFCSCGVCGFSH
jgi:hypothetical protein